MRKDLAAKKVGENTSSPPRYWFLALLMGAALLLRLGVGEALLQRGKALLPDSELYWAYAAAIFAGESYKAGDGGARRTPGYPIFLAGCLWLSGRDAGAFPPQPSAVRVVLVCQAFVGTATCLLVWLLGRNWERNGWAPLGAATLAALLAALDPFAIAIGSLILSETLFSMFLTAAAYYGLRSAQVKGRTATMFTGTAAGLAAGATVLVRPSALLLAPLAAILSRPRWRTTAAATVVFLVVLSPWWIRNAYVYHAFVPTTLNVGESLYDGWNPQADGGSNMSFVDREKPPADPEGSWQQREVRQDRRWRTEALGWAARNPGRVLELAVVKAVRFWSLRPNASEFQHPMISIVCASFSAVAYVLAAIGLWALLHSGRFSAPALALTPALYFCTLHMVFVSSVRYRTPATPLLLLLSGVGGATLMEISRGRSRR